MRLLALDFDGVISDSAPESFVVALRTYRDLRGADRHPVSFAHSTAGAAPPLPAVAADPLYTRFLETMPLGNRSEDFGVGLWALDEAVSLPDQPAYDRFRARLEPSWLKRFHGRFYELRGALRERDPVGWRRLMGPYPELLELLRRRRDDALLAIATAKDRESVELLLSDYGVADLFDRDRILDKETGVGKDAHLDELRRRFGVPYSEMRFVDDKVNHLDVAARLGVSCALAAWGYNGEREHALARERGYGVCTLQGAEAVLFA